MEIGTKVSNNKGWTGRIVHRPKHWKWNLHGPNKLVYVEWEERKAMMKSGNRSDHNIKDAVVSSLPENLTVIS